MWIFIPLALIVGYVLGLMSRYIFEPLTTEFDPITGEPTPQTDTEWVDDWIKKNK